MWRIILMVVRSIFKVPYYYYKLRYYAKEKNCNYPEAFTICRKIVKQAVKKGRITLEVVGQEHLPEKDGYLVTPNHQGMFDILVCVEGATSPFSFVAKQEVANVPVLKEVIAGLGGYTIDREDLRQSMRIMKEIERRLGEGTNFVIFPEGTRSRDGNQLLEFKGGTYKPAMKAKAPIVPCGLIDSYKAFDDKSIKPITVTIMYLEPIYYEEYQGMTTVELAAMVKERIQAAINNYQN